VPITETVTAFVTMPVTASVTQTDTMPPSSFPLLPLALSFVLTTSSLRAPSALRARLDS
jgi:hypothetical protein